MGWTSTLATIVSHGLVTSYLWHCRSSLRLSFARPSPLRWSLLMPLCQDKDPGDRKSTRLNSSHEKTSYAVFCLKKKKSKNVITLIKSLHPLLEDICADTYGVMIFLEFFISDVRKPPRSTLFHYATLFR